MSELPTLTRRELLERLAALVDTLEEPAHVAVDGPDAAGKTTLADELTSTLARRGRVAERISADDFLRPPAERYRLGRESAEGYYSDSFDLPALRDAVVASHGLALVDGIFLLRPELDDLWNLRIFVEVGEQEALRRGIARDGAATGRLYRVRYLPGQRLYAERVGPRDRADVVVENDDPARPRLVVRAGVRPRDA